jgi:hypothetical protein
MTRIRRSLEYALGMPSPNSIYGPILTQSTTSGNPKTAKCRIYPTGNRSSFSEAGHHFEAVAIGIQVAGEQLHFRFLPAYD